MRILNYNRRDEVMLLKFVENSCNVILLYWFDWRDRHYLPRPHRNPMGGRFYAPFNSLNFSENQKETSWAYWVNSRPLRANTCLSLSFHGNKYTYLFLSCMRKIVKKAWKRGASNNSCSHLLLPQEIRPHLLSIGLTNICSKCKVWPLSCPSSVLLASWICTSFILYTREQFNAAMLAVTELVASKRGAYCIIQPCSRSSTSIERSWIAFFHVCMRWWKVSALKNK